MVEFALVSIVAFLLMFGMFQFGLVILGNSAGSNAARDGARLGIINYATADTGGASYNEIVAAVQKNLSGNVSNLSVTVKCLNGTPPLAQVACNAVVLTRSDLIEVKASWNHKGFGPFMPSVSRSSTARMVITGAPDLTTVTTPSTMAAAPAITSLVLRNGGTTAGRMESNDTIEVTFSKQVRASTICSVWTDGNTTPQSTPGVTARATLSGTTTSIAVTGAPNCLTGYHFGTLNLDSKDFLDKNNDVVNFTNSDMSYDGTTHTLIIELGTPDAPALLTTEDDSVRASFTPDSFIKDSAGNAVSGTGSSSSKQF
jgi:Flp pilus assembly protein TadG